VLVRDHEQLLIAIEEVVACVQASDKVRAWTEWVTFHRSFARHLDAEESHLFPQFLAARPRQAQALLHEHRHLRQRACELRAQALREDLRVDVVRGFAAEMTAHMRRESGVWEQWVDVSLTDADRRELLLALAGPTA
jgi:hypothetical protein